MFATSSGDYLIKVRQEYTRRKQNKDKNTQKLALFLKIYLYKASKRSEEFALKLISAFSPQLSL